MLVLRKISGKETWLTLLLALLVCLITAALPAQAQELRQAQGMVMVNQLNIRSGPATSYNLVTVVYRGQTLALTGRTGDSAWVRVNAGSYSGWAYAAYLASDTPIPNLPVVGEPQPGPTPFGYVAVPYLNLRAGPGLNYPIIAGLERHTEMGLIGRNTDGSWIQISWGSSGAWVYASYLWTSYPLSNLPVTGNTPPPAQPLAWVTSYRLNFRSGPGFTFPIVAVLGRSAGVTLLGRDYAGTWLMVDIGQGQVAWAKRSFLQTNYPVMNLPLIMTGN